MAGGKLAPASGEVASNSTNTASGTYNFRLAPHLGLQFDGLLGYLDHQDVFSIGAHLYWRDKTLGLFGGTGNFTRWSGGIETERVGLQGAFYGLKNWNFEGTGGYEGGDIKSNFFDIVNAAYYPDPDIRTFIGHRRTRGKDAFAFGGEYLLPFEFAQLAPFAEGRLGSKDQTGFWIGVNIYFDDNNEDLIDKHRDADVWTDPVDELFPGVGVKSPCTQPVNVVAVTACNNLPPPPPPPPPTGPVPHGNDQGPSGPPSFPPGGNNNPPGVPNFPPFVLPPPPPPPNNPPPEVPPPGWGPPPCTVECD